MATGGALNLSLLSRGVGEVKRNGTEKVDVIFEPQDYFNFVEESQEHPFFLPPLQPRYGLQDGIQLSSRYNSKEYVHLPKTFTTRKGALLLFSEDMAHRTKTESKKHKHIHGFHNDNDLTESNLTDTSVEKDLKTVEDLANSILSYGSFHEEGKINLKFLQQRRRYDFERQIRPGFSAKRYLSIWTKTWDDTVLEKVINKGYLTERSLFYYNPLLPHLSRRLNDDLSHYPTPYKLMRSMLMSPGSLSGYTFYRVRPESQETDFYETEDFEGGDGTRTKSKLAGSVKVASVTSEGQLKETNYGHLDRQAQADVLTDLLVKGAVHYAMKTQLDYVDKMTEVTRDTVDVSNIPRFDMKDAVESMLQANEQRGIPHQMIDADLPDIEEKSQYSGSFKGVKLGTHRQHPGLWEKGPADGLPGSGWRDDASSTVSSGTPGPLPGPAPLPPIGQTYTMLTPIGEASREHTLAFSVHKTGRDERIGDEHADPWAGKVLSEKQHLEQKQLQKDAEEKRSKEIEKRKSRVSAQSLELLDGSKVDGAAAAQLSSSESIGPGSTHSSGWLPNIQKQQQWKGSQQSLRSHGSRKASGSLVDGADVGSGRGSIVYGPDGAVIKVGESIKLSARASEQGVHDVHEANVLPPGHIDASDESDNEIPDEWKKIQAQSGHTSQSLKIKDSPRSQITEQEIIDRLTSHATHIAASVLSQSDSGHVLEEDIRTAIEQVMRVQKRNSAGPTVAEYRDQIRDKLMTAIAKATGLNQSNIPADAEIDPALMEQLANHMLAPEDIEITTDPRTRRSFIRYRKRDMNEALGGVEKGHIYQSGGKQGDVGKTVSMPSERIAVEIGELGIINYGVTDDKQPSERDSDVGSKKGSAGDAKTISGKSLVSFKDDQQIQSEKVSAELPQAGSPLKRSDMDATSLKSGGSREDKKSKTSDKSKSAAATDKKEEFVVAAQVDHTKENAKIYGMPPNIRVAPRKPKDKKAAKVPAAGKKKGGKGKVKEKGKKKEDAKEEVTTALETLSTIKAASPEPPKVKSESPVSDRSDSMTIVRSEDEEDFVIVRDEPMSPESEKPNHFGNNATFMEEEDIDEQHPDGEMSDAGKLISNREARAAKRAAAAEKRKQEVERKRKEREEQMKREKEELERQERLKLELEEQRRQKEEERRLKRQREEEEVDEQARQEMARQQREKAEQEREKRRKEEFARKLEEMRKKQQEEEKRRQEEAERRRLEEEELKRQEQEMLAKMAEEERLLYETKKREEEEARLRKEEEDRLHREQDAIKALEEARKLAEEMARKQAELEARLRFNRSLQLESTGLEHTQDITKAFVFSYFELLQWLGLDIPEFELLKLSQY